MKVKRLDHLVLTVKNITDTCHFYTSVLGMEEITFAEGRKALTFGDQKITVHEYGKKFEPNALKPTPGSADLCFITDTPITDVTKHLGQLNIPIMKGPVIRTGAKGIIISVYVQDPDANLIEISNYLEGK